MKTENSGNLYSTQANETYVNWVSFDNNRELYGTVEAPLYTDSRITNEVIGLGPFSFINTLSRNDNRQLRPAIVLRVAQHSPTPNLTFPMKNAFDHYHGGDFIDEMAALASLVLGIRMQAGPVNREFIEGGDPKGLPRLHESKSLPVLPPIYQSPQIPRLLEGQNLGDLRHLEGYSKRTVEETNTLVKAARMYQQAIWISDADPVLAWLLLISAVETAAVTWAKDRNNPADYMRLSLPRLYDLLNVDTHRDLIEPVAKSVGHLIGATRKFVDFLIAFSPAPPPVRPAKAFQFSFAQANLKQAFGIIYRHRSANLHAGTAFPLPMCLPPKFWKFADVPDEGYAEEPTGLAMTSLGATWEYGETPMLLHTFEHIARGAILNWWHSSDVPESDNNRRAE